MVDYSNADRVAEDYRRSEQLAEAWARGEDTSVELPGTAFVHVQVLARRVNLVTGEVSFHWESL